MSVPDPAHPLLLPDAGGHLLCCQFGVGVVVAADGPAVPGKVLCAVVGWGPIWAILGVRV